MNPLDQHLFVAIQQGSPELVRAALAAGADINAEDGEGRQPIHYACHDVDLLRLLLDAGADPLSWDEEGAEAIHLAAHYGDRDCIEAVLTGGGDLEGEAWGDENAATWAARILDEPDLTAQDRARALDNLRCLAEHGLAFDEETTAALNRLEAEKCAEQAQATARRERIQSNLFGAVKEGVADRSP